MPGVAAEKARSQHAHALAHRSGAVEQLAEHDRRAPGLLARIFRTRRAREWSLARVPLAATEQQARLEASSTAQRLVREEKTLEEATAHSQVTERLRAEAVRRHIEARREVK